MTTKSGLFTKTAEIPINLFAGVFGGRSFMSDQARVDGNGNVVDGSNCDANGTDYEQ
jgi:hypothetical protein